MGSWYRVIKTIKGHRYVYEQRTWREGKHVRTQSRYIGPAGDSGSGMGAPSAGEGPEHVGASVNTTEAARIDPTLVDDVLDALTKPVSQRGRWTQSWDEDLKGENLVERIPEIDDVLERLHAVQTLWSGGPHYNPADDYIHIPPSQCFFDTSTETATQAYYIVLLHEHAHWTGHKRRLDRLPCDPFRTKNYAREELVAEATAVMLMKHFEIAPADLSQRADYFQTWLGRAGDRAEALAFARREAERAAWFILGVNATNGQGNANVA